MKLSTLIFIVGLLAFSYTSSAQYYRTVVSGNTPKTLNKDRVNVKLDTDPDWTTIFAQTTTPQWSTVQSLPFNFQFNGSPVTNYKVSSTGVLTFSTGATSVPGATPSALPSSSVPNNSICLWGIQPLHARSFISHKTFGSPGNRQYWVMFSFCPNGTIALSTWSMVLEEGTNNIYLVQQWNGAGGTSALSVGIQINSSLAFSDPLSPSVPVVSKYDFSMADDLYHRFAPGTQPQKDVELVDFAMPYYVAPGNKTIKGTVHNVGTDPITNLNVSWNDGLGPVSENLSVNIAPNSTYNFTCTKQWNAVAGPQKILNLTVTIPGDANPLNNSYDKAVTVLGITPKKYVVVEERTGTWCGWCPRGAVGMAHLEQEPEFIGIAVHSNDPMEVQNYDELIGTFMTGGGFPGAMFDRDNETGFNSTASVLSAFNLRKSYPVPCEVKNLSVNINNTSNEINISGETEWFGTIRGDYRLSCVIVEDDVIGTSSNWFQSNAYENGNNGVMQFPSNVNNGFDFSTASHPTNPIGFGGYDHVARYLSSGGLLGEPNSLPAGEVPTGTHSYTFSPIPSSFVKDFSKAQAIVMIVDEHTGDILNAKKIALNASPTKITEVEEKVNLIVFPNPAQGIVNISYNSKKMLSNATLILNDLNGTEVSKVRFNGSNQKVSIDTKGISSGVFFLKLISDGQIIHTEKLFIVQ